MELKTIRENAREKMKGTCILCKECNGVWCAGMVPGMGGAGTAESFKRAHEKLKDYKLMLRTIHSAKEPVTTKTLFGKELSFPVIGAPITGAKYNMAGGITEEEYAHAVVKGAVDAGTISMIGDTGDLTAYDHGLKAITDVGGAGIPIIKPRSNEEIILRIKLAEKAGCLAVGIDIDGAGLITMKLFGQPVGPKTLDELKELVNNTHLPFVVKGIMCVEDALMCVEAGVSAIVVSNHGGRVLNEGLAPIEVLEEIVEAVGDKLTVLADGSIREGVDVMKYLALGAKGVLLGRPMIWGAVGGGQEGVKVTMETLKTQIVQAMILTGCNSVENISKKIVRKI